MTAELAPAAIPAQIDMQEPVSKLTFLHALIVSCYMISNTNSICYVYAF